MEDQFISDKETQIQENPRNIYKLTYDEILVIDPDTPILKDDYDSIVC